MRKLCISFECQTESTNKRKKGKIQNFLSFCLKEGSEWPRKKDYPLLTPLYLRNRRRKTQNAKQRRMVNAKK